MCGIAGILAREACPAGAALERMVTSMRHRGPDDSGVEQFVAGDRECWLGSTRLAIIDLSPAGHMPMGDPESGNSIVLNGEVYNFQDLRRRLESQGEAFASNTDTEVVLRLYRREGVDCLNRLRGMFALAIWDAGRRELFLARDRSGKKPLYYYAGTNVFVLASEVRALLASGLVERRLNCEALEVFLANGFLVSPMTLVRNVRSLLPGHWMRVSAEKGILGNECYWRPMYPGSAIKKKAESDVEETRLLFQEAVDIRRVSDVPLGVFLSGGLDSSAVVAGLHQAGVPVRTFSVGFPEDAGNDESGYSRQVASFFDTQHTEIPIISTDFWRWLPGALDAMDQPTFDGMNTYCVAKAAGESGLKVALSGIGADELFGGYPFFRSVPYLRMLARVWGNLPRWSRPILGGKSSGKAWFRCLAGPRKVADLFKFWGGNSENAANQLLPYQVAQSLFPARARGMLLAQSVNRRDERAINVMGLPNEFVTFLSREMPENDQTAALSHLAWRLFLGERCLRDMDSMSMAVSLEMRAPFTDHLFVEHVLRLPGRLRCGGAPDKPWEWRLMETLLGDGLAPRKKHGFIFPFQNWLQTPGGQTLMDGVLRDREAVAGAGLEPGAVADLWEAFCRGAVRIPWSRVWAIFVLVHWCRRWEVTV